MLNHARMHAPKPSGKGICADRASRPDGAVRKLSATCNEDYSAERRNNLDRSRAHLFSHANAMQPRHVPEAVLRYEREPTTTARAFVACV